MIELCHGECLRERLDMSFSSQSGRHCTRCAYVETNYSGSCDVFLI